MPGSVAEYAARGGVWVPLTGGTVTPPPPDTNPGFPDATNTGVPDGTTLLRVPQDVSSGPGWAWQSGGWVNVNGPGATFDGFSVVGSVNVLVDGCTISNCRIVNTGNDNGISIRNANNTTVSHCTVSGATAGGADENRLTGGIKDVFQNTTGTVLDANNIFDCSGGIALNSGTVTNNYIHDMGYNSVDHVDCYQSFDIGELLIQGNTFFNEQGQTACILLQWTNTADSGKTIDGNLFAGGGYCLYGGDNATGVVFTNNQISTRFFPQGGQFGYLAHWQVGNAGNVWSGNTWADGPNAGMGIPTT